MKDLLAELYHAAKALADPRFWAFFGTGLIVSVAYMDPGNWGTSISAGARFDYALLWVVWLSSLMAMLFQYLSGKLGIAGYTVAGLARESLGDRRAVFAYWLLAEVAILATDLAEFLGIVVALNLLFGIPLIIGTFLAIADVLLLLFLASRTFRTLEYAFILFVSVIGIGYVYELFLTRPDAGQVAIHSVLPALDPQMILFAVGIVGATVMPHALFVHSWLMKNKMAEKGEEIGRKQALRYHLADNVLSLLVAGLINAAILIMAASAFFRAGIAVATIDEAYRTLTPLFGTLASTVFALGLLSAGISSSITGTLAGQSIMESLTDFRIKPVWRRVITRVINIIPILLAIAAGIEPLEILVYSQVALSLLIPLPLIPLIIFTSDRKRMGDLTNRTATTAVAWIFAGAILALNAYLLVSAAASL